MREDDEIFKFIYKDTLKEILSELQTEAHHIYALMSGLPKANFHLCRYYDMANDIEAWDEDMENNTFTIQEFYDRYDTFHPDDDFGICLSVHFDMVESDKADEYCESISISSRAEAMIELLNDYFDEFLESYCERCLRDNHPFELTPEIVAQYGFTPEDIEKLRKLLKRYNTAAKKKIMAEFEALCKLDFIRNKQ